MPHPGSPGPSRLGQPFLDEAKARACVHCGLCLSSCPTYLETGSENESPRGRIYLMRALDAGRLEPGTGVERHFDLCLGCRACEAACPSGVEYGQLLEHTRDFAEKHIRRSWFQTFLRRLVIERIFPVPERLEVALIPARWIRQLGLEVFLPAFLRDTLALIPPEPPPASTPTPPSETFPAAKPGRKVGLIRGCVMPVMFPGTQVATERLLRRDGFEVVVPAGQGCCGALHAHSGKLELARAQARVNIEAFERAGVDLIVINAAGCGSTLKEYGALLAGDAAWVERARRFSARVKDLTEVLSESRPERQHPCAPDRAGVTYHDACHLAHAQRITAPPRRLVRALAGDQFVELDEAEVCCGSAGTYNLTEPAMAARLQRRKVAHILKSGARTVVTSNPGCLLQIRAGLEQVGRPDIRVMHIADFLDDPSARPGAMVPTPTPAPSLGS